MIAPKKILVPIDMSAYSLAGIQYAQEIAELFNAEVVVLNVDDQHHGRSLSVSESRERVEGIIRAIQRLLIDHHLVSHSLRIEVRSGSPAIEIVHAAQQLGCDLLVMSTHGRSGLRHILMGSVAEKVVRFSKIPVLTVKPEDIREFVEITDEDIAHDLHEG